MTDVFTGRAPVRLDVSFPSASNEPVQNENRAPDMIAPMADVNYMPSEALDGPPVYSMSRACHLTVADLWREWTVGLGGGPAVSDLERAWKRKWRKSNTETKFFSRRKVIIDHIVALKDRVGIERALHQLETLRTGRNLSLDGLRVLIERGEA